MDVKDKQGGGRENGGELEIEKRRRRLGHGEKRKLGVRDGQGLHSVALGRFWEDMHCMKH